MLGCEWLKKAFHLHTNYFDVLFTFIQKDIFHFKVPRKKQMQEKNFFSSFVGIVLDCMYNQLL